MGPNVLALALRRCLAIEGNPITKRRMEAAGCEVLTYSGLELSLKAEGGATCLTRPILRAESFVRGFGSRCGRLNADRFGHEFGGRRSDKLRSPASADIVARVEPLVIRNLPEGTQAALRARAARHRHSVEAEVRAILARERPGDAIFGEEQGGTPVFEGRQWVIDPIDGTKNFVRGVPVWASLIALLEDGVPTVGMVSAPALNRRLSLIHI